VSILFSSLRKEIELRGSYTVQFQTLYIPHLSRCYASQIWPDVIHWHLTLPLYSLGRWWFCVPLTYEVHSVVLGASLRSAY
jgi:hypothetical protein